MEAYTRLARLPEPTLRRVALPGLVRRIAALEQRIAVQVTDGRSWRSRRTKTSCRRP